jgi:hypothetical protein
MTIAFRAVPLALPLSLTSGVLKPASRRYFGETFLHFVRGSYAVLVHGYMTAIVGCLGLSKPFHRGVVEMLRR